MSKNHCIIQFFDCIISEQCSPDEKFEFSCPCPSVTKFVTANALPCCIEEILASYKEVCRLMDGELDNIMAESCLFMPCSGIPCCFHHPHRVII